MNSRAKSLLPPINPSALIVLVIILAFSFVGIVLIPGIELASGLVESTVALKFVGEQQRYPTVIRGSLEGLHDRLTTRTYVQDSVEELRGAAAKLDAALPVLYAPRTASWFALTGDTSAVAEPIASKHSAALRTLWEHEQEVLKPLVSYSGVPYQDSESSGTVLNESGRQLDQDVMTALRSSRHELAQFEKELAAVGDQLQATNSQWARELQLVMLAGLVIAATLVLLVALLLAARRRQEESLRDARQQTVDILRTVKDGLFLLDEDLTIGAAYSSALETMFQRQDIAGLPFESLLKNTVSEKTLATALKFVKILWSERTNEKLVKSINPLGEVEIHIDAGHGKFETHYLQFDFHRVRVDRRITHVLVAVSDVSARVELALELQASQNQSQAQIDTLLGILHIDPVQLASFLNDSNTAMKLINAVLREPAREESAFRKKLDTLFRQAHAVKGEAAALGLSSIQSRAHSFEDDLKALREKQGLSGNDFLPLVIKLDDLLTHLQSVGDLVSRLSHLQLKAPEAVHTKTDVIRKIPPVSAAASGSASAPVPTDTGLASMLQQLAARVAADNHKEARVKCVGFEEVPDEYRSLVKDISIQAIRNAIVHGIEPAAARSAAGKRREGTVRLSFQPTGDTGYRFSVEDDGQGLATERIKAVAVNKGIITADQAVTLDAKQVYSLLFQPGFTTVDETTMDAGRGVGMDLIAQRMQEIGGRVGLATVAGKFTRLTLSLPPCDKRDDDTVAA